MTQANKLSTLIIMLEQVFGVNIGDPGLNPTPALTNYGALVSIVVKNAFVLGGVVCFILLISGGFQFIVAAGDTKKLEKSRGVLSSAIIGLVVVVASFWIIEIIGVITGKSLLNPGV